MRRGPKPKASDRQRLEARQVWARLRIQDDIRVSRARVSPLTREHGLLSSHRQPQKPPNAHNG
ncbi:MAG: IS3 family transposase [Burkholderia sp.]